MKVLVISLENWDSTTNGGNVLTNIFSGLDFDFAQIYCSSSLPNNNLCDSYFQISDRMVLNNLLKNKEVGRLLESNNQTLDKEDLRFETSSKKRRWQTIFMLRELVWSLAKIDNKNFIKFIQDFDPDVIFAPCYGHIRMLKLTRLVKKYTKAHIISYVSDDLYSYKYYSYNLLFWIRRWNLRRHVRKTVALYDLMYTMTQEQLEEYQRYFSCDMKILRKSCVYEGGNKLEKPYRLIYGGNLYLNRSDILIELVQAMSKFNKEKLTFVLDIYSQSELDSKSLEVLNNGYDTFFHKAISPIALKEEYKKASIALHVESMDKKNSLITRLSFSTKITDCLESGAALMAICPSINAGFKYLKEEDCAICISDVTKIEEELQKIVDDETYLKTYVAKAKKCIENNHSKEENMKMLLDDFTRVACLKEDLCTKNT